MAYMRSYIAFALFWINLVIVILNVVFYTSTNNKEYNTTYYSYHLRGTKERLQDLNNYENPKELRNLKVNGVAEYIIFLDIAAMFFVLILMFSFCLTKNECCTSDNSAFAIGSCYGACLCCDDCCRHTTCTCDCHSSGGNDNGCGILILLLFIIVFVAIFFAIRACGKHISRVVSVIMLILLELGMAGLAMYTGGDQTLTMIFVFNLIAAICNLIAIILPNVSGCNVLSYEYIPPVSGPTNPIVVTNPVTPVAAQPLVQPAPIPNYPEQPMVPIYTDPNQNQGYDNTTGNAYNELQYGNPQQNYYGNAPTPNYNYPNPQ